MSPPKPKKRKIKLHGCTGIIVTGGEYAILGKNSDTNNNQNEYPIHCPSKSFTLNYSSEPGIADSKQVTSYAYSGCNSYRMSGSRMPFELNTVVWGMNERGLAAMYTQIDVNHTKMNVGVTDNPLGLGTRGRELCTLILALYERVQDVLDDINDPSSIIGPNNRRNEDSISIIDRFGNGVIIEVSIEKAVYHKVVNGYFVEDNAIRIWDLNLAGEAYNIRPESESGPRTTYIKQIADEVIDKEGEITYKNMVQKIMRYIKHKENGDTPFSINESGIWDIVNDGTASSFVAISGDQRYEGKLNCFWGEYGNPAIIGLYLPHIPYAGDIPINGAGFWDSMMPATSMRKYVDNVMRTGSGAYNASWIYDPNKIREKQKYIFDIEDYTFDIYNSQIKNSDITKDLKTFLSEFVTDVQQTATTLYILGSPQVEVTYNSYPIPVDCTINGETVIPNSTTYIDVGEKIIQVPQKIIVEPEIIDVNSAIHLTSSFNGHNNIYKRGPNLTDTALFFLDGNDVTLSNVILDDNWFGGVQAAVFIKGKRNKVVYNKLKNCKRYGFSTLGAEDFEVAFNTIDAAQHAISGSGAISRRGKIHDNLILSEWNDAFKCKNWQDVEIWNNKVYLHPILPNQTGGPSGVSFNSDEPNLNMNVDVHDNEFYKTDGSSIPAYMFTVEGESQGVPYVWGDLAYDSSGNIIHTGIPNLKFRNNICEKIGSGGTVYAGIIRGNYIEAINNTFIGLNRQIIVYSGTVGNVVSPNIYR